MLTLLAFISACNTTPTTSTGQSSASKAAKQKDRKECQLESKAYFYSDLDACKFTDKQLAKLTIERYLSNAEFNNVVIRDSVLTNVTVSDNLINGLTFKNSDLSFARIENNRGAPNFVSTKLDYASIDGKLCNKGSTDVCKPRVVYKNSAVDAIRFLLEYEFGSLINRDYSPNKQKDSRPNFKFPDDPIVLLNKSDTKLASTISVFGNKMRVLNSAEIVKQQITHFITIASIKKQDDGILIEWQRPMKARFGKALISQADGHLVYKKIENFHSGSMGRSVMRELYQGVSCRDETQLAYYSSFYKHGKCAGK